MLAVVALAPFVVAVTLYFIPSTTAINAQLTNPVSAKWQGWIHLLLALFFLVLLPLPAALFTHCRRPRGPLDCTAQAAGWGGFVVSAWTMAIQADGWFHATYASGGALPDQFVQHAVQYNNVILGGLGEFTATVLLAGWLGWVVKRTAGIPLALRLFGYTTAALLLLGKPGSYVFPICAAAIGVWLTRTAGEGKLVQTK